MTDPSASPAANNPSWVGEWSRFWMATPARRVQLFTLLTALWLAIFANQWLRVDKTIAGAHRVLGVQAETVYVPPTPVLRMASLGHQSFAADLLYLRVAHYFVDHLIGDSQLPWIDVYLNAIWGLDAYNQSTYRWAAQVIKFGQNIDLSVAERANQFCRLGLEHFPGDSWLYHEIAFNLHFHMSTVAPEVRKANEELALEYLKLAFEMPGFGQDPNYLAHQYARAGRVDESVQLALQTYASATAAQRLQLRRRLEDRNRKDAARELAWLDRLVLRDWPHVPETLARLIGPKRVNAPPLRPERPENWRPEHATPEKVWDALGTRQVAVPTGMQDPAETRADRNEYAPVDGSVAATQTRVEEDPGAPRKPVD